MTCRLPESIYADLCNLHVTREDQRRHPSTAHKRLQAGLDQCFPELMTAFQNPTG